MRKISFGLGTVLLFLFQTSCPLKDPIVEPAVIKPPHRRSETLSDSKCSDISKLREDKSSDQNAVLNGPKHLSYTYLNFNNDDNAKIRKVVIDLDLCNVPEKRSYGMYLQFFMKIGETPAYFGFQTKLMNPKTGWSGKGFIFSRWGDLNPSNFRTAQGGFSEIGTHEGEFIGVRVQNDFSAGPYQLILENTEAYWYKLTIRNPAGKLINVGSLRFSGNNKLTDFTIATEAYAMNDVPVSDLPVWQFVINPKVNDLKAVSGRVTYPTPTYPYGWVKLISDSSRPIHVLYGGKFSREGGLAGNFIP